MTKWTYITTLVNINRLGQFEALNCTSGTSTFTSYILLANVMPRTYVPVPGHRYQNYSDEDLAAALHAVKNTDTTISAAAKKFGIPRRTLSDKLSGSHPLKTGGQPVFSAAEEHEIANTLQVAADWGFPMTSLDLRLLIKSFLNAKGVQERRFKENTPGIDFIKSFARRNKMVFRVAGNIRSSRAKISSQDIQAYLANVQPFVKTFQPPISSFMMISTSRRTREPKSFWLAVEQGASRTSGTIPKSPFQSWLVGPLMGQCYHLW